MLKRKAAAEKSLIEFIKMFWHCVEPEKPFVYGWAMAAICQHLEAISNGGIRRLIVNVPPGFSKSICVDVFFSAWEWGPRNMPSMRYICTSSQAYLTERDNQRFLRVVSDPLYQRLWGDRFKLDLVGVSNITSDKTGFKLASTTSGLTGSRGNRVLIDDPNSTDPRRNESDIQREGVNNWLMEVMPDRLNSMENDAIILIQQRTHESDATATLMERGQDYCHLMIPMEYDPMRHCETEIGWSDPRIHDGELAWPERFPGSVIEKLKIEKGPFAFASQYQQSPVARGGNIIKQDWWKLYDLDYAKRLGLVQEGSTKLVYPPFDLVVVSVDTALTEKKENCYSGCVVMGVWKDEKDLTKIMLIYAWQARLKLHGESPLSSDTEQQKKDKEGLVERIARTASALPIGVTPKGAQAILIENKANGPDVINEIARLYRNRNWQVIPIDPKGDKVARAHATVPTFTQGLIYAPDKEWAQLVINQMASFPRGKDKDLCFVAGTMIATNRGDVPIEKIKPGDLILTPDGFHSVLSSGCTGLSKTVSRCGLSGTPEHRILSIDLVYRMLYDITPHQIIGLSLWNLILCSSLKALFSTETITDCWEEKENIIIEITEKITANSALKVFMSMCGNLILARQFRRVMKLIIKMIIHSITVISIWSVYRWQCIVRCLKQTLISGNQENTWRISGLLRKPGTDQKKDEHGIDSTLLTVLQKHAFRLRAFVKDAVRNLWQKPRLEQDFAAITVGCSSIIEGNQINQSAPLGFLARSVEKCIYLSRSKANKYVPVAVGSVFSGDEEKKMVYNLSVEGTRCYFANGILVHNCDALTQCILYLRNAGVIVRPDEETEERAARNMIHSKDNNENIYGA